MKIFQSFVRATKNMSPLDLFFFSMSFPMRKIRRYRDGRALAKENSLGDRFTLIYDRNMWGSKESASGSGSTLEMTVSIRTLLPELLQNFQIKSIFDAPCGDFNWMQFVDLGSVTYVGGDIVEDLIDLLNARYSNGNRSFLRFDITNQIFPDCDLVLIRDCFFHFSFEDIFLTFTNFLNSKSKFLLSTSHENDSNFINTDIRSGDFRLLDLFSYPFNFSPNYHFQIPEQGEGSAPRRKLYLWDHYQVSAASKNLEKFLRGL